MVVGVVERNGCCMEYTCPCVNVPGFLSAPNQEMSLPLHYVALDQTLPTLILSWRPKKTPTGLKWINPEVTSGQNLMDI